MERGARTPEELETLLEDAFLLRDPEEVARLFGDGAILVPGHGLREARGPHEIAQMARSMWNHEGTYVADVQRVLQARDTALVLAEGSINVMRRDAQGAWWYAIALLSAEIHVSKKRPREEETC